MFQFFDGIAAFLASLVSFVVNFFAGLLSLFKMMGTSLVYITECIGYLPPFLIVFVTAIIGLSIIMTIINHGG